MKQVMLFQTHPNFVYTNWVYLYSWYVQAASEASDTLICYATHKDIVAVLEANKTDNMVIRLCSDCTYQEILDDIESSDKFWHIPPSGLCTFPVSYTTDLSKKCRNKRTLCMLIRKFVGIKEHSVTICQDPYDKNFCTKQRIFYHELNDGVITVLNVTDNERFEIHDNCLGVDTGVLGFPLQTEISVDKTLGTFGIYAAGIKSSKRYALFPILSAFEDVVVWDTNDKNAKRPFIPLHEYHEKLSISKSTLILVPPCDANSLSINRIHQALSHQCLPICTRLSDTKYMPKDLADMMTDNGLVLDIQSETFVDDVAKINDNYQEIFSNLQKSDWYQNYHKRCSDILETIKAIATNQKQETHSIQGT